MIQLLYIRSSWQNHLIPTESQSYRTVCFFNRGVFTHHHLLHHFTNLSFTVKPCWWPIAVAAVCKETDQLAGDSTEADSLDRPPSSWRFPTFFFFTTSCTVPPLPETGKK